jgi:AcrR family transcriptional regulator
MGKHQEILAGAELAFEAEGFRGIGVDKILSKSGVSTRTLYKHFGSRDGLVIEVLRQRNVAFMQLLSEADATDPVGEIFDIQSKWSNEHVTSGCMFLRAHGEYAAINADIIAVVNEHKKNFEIEIGRRVEIALGRPDPQLAMQIWILFEGATALANLRGRTVLADARETAIALLRARLERAS